MRKTTLITVVYRGCVDKFIIGLWAESLVIGSFIGVAKGGSSE